MLQLRSRTIVLCASLEFIMFRSTRRPDNKRFAQVTSSSFSETFKNKNSREKGERTDEGLMKNSGLYLNYLRRHLIYALSPRRVRPAVAVIIQRVYRECNISMEESATVSIYVTCNLRILSGGMLLATARILVTVKLLWQFLRLSSNRGFRIRDNVDGGMLVRGTLRTDVLSSSRRAVHSPAAFNFR